MKSVASRIWKGQTIMRILMDEGMRAHTIKGETIDVGGGRNPDYFGYLQKEPGTRVTSVDWSISRIDFEKDALPFKECFADCALLCNVLEHIYNHRFLVGEIHRVLKRDGRLIGFVPFFIQYHPDPHDYFRYTREALDLIFKGAGFRGVDITTVGAGPFTVNLNNMMLSLPRVLRVAFYGPTVMLDRLFLKLRPNARERYPLGYIFSAVK